MYIYQATSDYSPEQTALIQQSNQLIAICKIKLLETYLM